MKICFILLLLISSPVSYALDCSSLWARGFPDSGTGSATLECDEYRADGSVRLPNNIRLFLDRELSTLSDYQPILKAAAEGASATYRAFKDVFGGSNTNIVFYHKFHPVDPNVYAFSSPLHNHPELEACPIIIYPNILLFEREQVKQLIAHEMFHCMAFKKFPAQMTAAMLDRRNQWHHEGLAQFFSNLVFPRANWEYSSNFPLLDHERQLTRQGNSNRAAHFWQSYHWYIGLNTTVLLDFISNLPTTVGVNPIEIFNRLPNAAKGFHRFVEEVFSETLKETDTSTGHPIMVINPIQYTLTDEIDQTFELRYRTMSLFSHRLPLLPGHRYSIKIELPDTESIATARLIEDDVHYDKLPLNITVPCDQTKTLEVLISTTGLDENLRKARLIIKQVKSENCQDCDISEEIKDQCLVGNWEVNKASYRKMKERLLPPLTSVLDDIRGGYYMVITPREMNIAYENFILYFSGVINGIPLQMEQEYIGEAVAGIQANDGKGCFKKIGSLMSVRQTIKTPMGDTTSMLPHDFEAPVVNFRYECAPQQLKFIYSQDPSSGSSIEYELIYDRLF